jgi:hypothetical protein
MKNAGNSLHLLSPQNLQKRCAQEGRDVCEFRAIKERDFANTGLPVEQKSVALSRNSLPGIYLAVYLHVNSQPGCGKNFATEE